MYEDLGVQHQCPTATWVLLLNNFFIFGFVCAGGQNFSFDNLVGKKINMSKLKESLEIPRNFSDNSGSIPNVKSSTSPLIKSSSTRQAQSPSSFSTALNSALMKTNSMQSLPLGKKYEITSELKNELESYAAARSKLLEQHLSDSNWSHQQTDKKEGITLSYKKHEDNNVYLRKGTFEVDVSAKEFVDYVKGIDTMHAWDPTLCHSHYIERLDDNMDIFYLVYDFGVPFVSCRDFVLLEVRKEMEEGGYEICTISISNELVDELACKKSLEKKCVRGEILLSGWIIKPLSFNRCEATFVIQVDCKGSLPKSIINSTSMVSVFKNIKRNIRKKQDLLKT